MWPAIAAGISGALSLIGGRKSQNFQEDQSRANTALQKEFAQHGVRWRVEDAKAAGLHPLYALGAQLPTFSPTFSMDAMGPAIAQAGQDIGRAVSSIQTKAERTAAGLQLKALEKSIEESDARIGLLRSEAARNAQMVGPQTFPMAESSSPSNGLIPEALLPFHNQGYVESQGTPALTTRVQDSALTAGFNPMWSEYEVAEGRRMVLPSSSSGGASEGLESITESLPVMLMVYNENVARYGQEWGDWFAQRYLIPEFGHEWWENVQEFFRPGGLRRMLGY